MKRLIAFCIFFIQLTAGVSQIKILPEGQALADLDLLQSSLQEGHPALYLYQQKKKFEKQFAQLRDKVKGGINMIDLYLLLAKALAQIEDGHTRMVLPDDYRNFIYYESNSVIPFALKFKDQKIYIYQNYSSEPAMQDGAEILSLNNIKSKDLLATLYTLVSADAGITGFFKQEAGA